MESSPFPQTPPHAHRCVRVAAGAMAALLLFVGTVAGAVAAQGRRPEVSARLTQGIVKLGAEVQLVIEVEGTENASLVTLPEVSGLTIGPAGPPSRQFYQSFVNGRYESSTRSRWVVPVRPFGTGEYEIPPVELRVDGDVVETRALRLNVVEDLEGANLGRIDVRASSPEIVEGQPFSVEIRFGIDAAMASRINYFNLSLPWWDALPGTVVVESDAQPPAQRTVEVVLNDSRETLRCELVEPEMVDGREFAMLRVRRSYLATRTGELDLSGSIFEFARVEERSRGFFDRRVEKVESYYVVADPYVVRVSSLPEDGRPFDFGGAIGDLSVRAETDSRDVVVGDSIKLTVRWYGEGNFEFFDVPDPGRADAFGGFRVYGSTEESKGFDHREVVYDLAPLSPEVDRIPPIRLPYYDPEEGRYREVATPELGIRVRPLEDALTLSEEDGRPTFREDLRDVRTRLGEGEELGRPGTGLVAGSLAGVSLGWLLLRTGVRRRRGDPDAPAERRRRRARRRLRRALGRADGAEAELDAVYAFLAARTKETPEAWVGRDVRAWAAATGRLGAEEAEALARRLDELEACAWGGREGPPDRRELLDVCERAAAAGL